MAGDEDAQRIIEVFRRFDANKNGCIERGELARVLQDIDPGAWDDSAIDSLLDAADRNGDGAIQYEEFISWLTRDVEESDDALAEPVWAAVAPGAALPVGAKALLDAIATMSPHLVGNPTFQEARSMVEADDLGHARLLADTLLLQLESDRSRVDAAFLKFDYDGTGKLEKAEISAMFQYLGFPDPEEDDTIKELVGKVDPDESGNWEKEEFKHFVEEFGGCGALFAKRRERMMAGRSVSLGDCEAILPERREEELSAAGIEPAAQAYWELVLPETELRAAVLLTACQKKALSNIRNIAKVNHAKALPILQKRVLKLGYKDMDLWTTLSWIRDFAPIIVHFHFDKMAKFLKEDTHYRSQFETGSSCGLNNREVRERWERDLFRGAYDGCTNFEKPKYGVLNVMNDYQGVVRAKQYGDGYMILKDVRLRTTFSPEDSANLKAERLACLDYYAHVLNEYTDKELRETLKVATTETLGASDAIDSSGLKYKEAQYHGEIAFAKHIERIVLPRVSKYESRKDEIDEVCALHGWDFSWMDDEKKRREQLQADDKADPKLEEWKAKLKAMAEAPKDSGDGARIPEGFCIRGCGKPVAPGMTRSGNPFKTCCRGCALGFGHDVRCGIHEGERPPCKMGCGMLAAPGVSRRGNPMDTCCRNCVRGQGHNVHCTQEPC